MKTLLFALLLSFPAAAAEKSCACKCVTKEEDGKFSTEEARGADREQAGEKLKQKLGKRKCELSPVCAGAC